MKKLCFVDMDGVLADFVSAACRAHERPNPYQDAAHHGVWDLATIWGITPKEVWAPLNGEDFWIDIPKLPLADELVELLLSTFGSDNICVASSPSMSKYCVPGKREWMVRAYPALAKNMLFGSAKQFLAGPNRCLIDDFDGNVDKWKAFGGYGILYPQLWNSGHNIAELRLQRVAVCLQEWK